MASFHSRISTLFEDQLVQQTSSSTVKFSWVYPLHVKKDKRCAVLCCLREAEDGRVLVLITRRSDKLSSHPGEPCFPGGKEEILDDCLEDTALREAEEEINLKRDNVNIITVLPPLIVGSTGGVSQCYTVVCTLNTHVNDLHLQSSSEVNDVYWIPLKFFLNGENWTSSMLLFGTRWSFNAFKVTNEEAVIVVWGLTARLCTIIASVVYSQPPNMPFTESYIDSFNSDGINFCSFLLPNINTGIISKL